MHEQQSNSKLSTPGYSTGRVFFRGGSIGYEEAPLLEGILQIPSRTGSYPAVVLCHANPKAGGHMDMRVMEAVEAALAGSGIASLRYNSRGIGQSEGQISGYSDRKLVTPEGEPEMADVAYALDFLAAQEGVDSTRLALVGHSFGARISLAYLEQHPTDTRMRAVVCIGLAVAWGDLSHLGHWRGPKLFVTGERDDFCPPQLLEKFVATLPPPATQVLLKNTGHFFEGREDDLGAVVAEYLRGVF